MQPMGGGWPNLFVDNRSRYEGTVLGQNLGAPSDRPSEDERLMNGWHGCPEDREVCARSGK